MVHYKKSFSTYVFFTSTLVGMKPELSSLKCFGTDGEEALYEAFGHVFPGALHLLCSLHMKRNVKAKLKELGVGDSVQQIVIGDIFGRQVMSEQVMSVQMMRNLRKVQRPSEVSGRGWIHMTVMGPCMLLDDGFVGTKKSSKEENAERNSY